MSALISPHQPRTDYVIVQRWYNLGKFLAMTPLSADNGQNKLLHSVTRAYPVVLMLLYLGATMFSFYERFYIYQNFNISQTILDFLQGLTETFFVEHVILWSMVKKNHWKKLMRFMTQLEQKLNWSFSNRPVPDSTWKWVRLRIIVFHFAYVAVHLYDSVINWVYLSYSLAFIIFRITTYYLMFSTLFLTFFCTWLENRYRYLENYLKTVGVSRNWKFTLLQKDYVNDKTEEFSHNYRNLFLIVSEANAIFGIYYFFIAICTVLEILNAVNYGMPTAHQTVNDGTVAVNVVYLTLYTICNVQTVLSCDRVIRVAKSISKTCLIVHDQSENAELRHQLAHLSHLIQGLSPEFSASGFWTVNKSVLSTLFSSVMTYLIIIIQFNMTLK